MDIKVILIEQMTKERTVLINNLNAFNIDSLREKGVDIYPILESTNKLLKYYTESRKEESLNAIMLEMKAPVMDRITGVKFNMKTILN